GFVCEFEEAGSHRYKTDLLEYLLIDINNNTLYKKHPYTANIQFEPVLLLEHSDTLSQSFSISHPLSVQSYSLYGIGGRTYIQKVLFKSFYTNNTDTIYNPDRNVNFISEVDFSFKFIIDTNKYNQGYYLHYKITAEDKGLVTGYYSSPDTGYYKLFWKDSSTTSIETEQDIPLSFALHQNYPNPFNPSTKISWQSPAGSHQTLKVYDVLGREVATLVDEYKDAGYHEVEFQLSVGNRQYASGIYYYQLKAGSFIETKKMMVIR
ncbi:MAG: T9SS type A sorting domain-containing protein, partial [Ignavibacteriaceae bacterium]